MGQSCPPPIAIATHAFEALQELESDSLVLQFVFALGALHGEVPVEVVGQLSAARCSRQQETGQVWKLSQECQIQFGRQRGG